jgi:large subunit ribosomal protein L2
MTLKKIPIGCCIYNVSLKYNGFSIMSRSAGTYCIIIKKSKTDVTLLLSSGQQKQLPLTAFGTIGVVSNGLVFLAELGKAGRTRWLGKRPTVRGVAMNPVDHPHGGGEGKKSGKRKTPWGKSMNSYNPKNVRN